MAKEVLYVTPSLLGISSVHMTLLNEFCKFKTRPKSGLFFVHFPVKSVKRFVRFFELAQFGTRVSSFWYMS